MKYRKTYDGMGDRIKAARKSLGRPQSWLGKHVGMSREAISKIECNKNTPHEHNLEQIAKITHTTVDYLKYGKE